MVAVGRARRPPSTQRSGAGSGGAGCGRGRRSGNRDAETPRGNSHAGQQGHGGCLFSSNFEDLPRRVLQSSPSGSRLAATQPSPICQDPRGGRSLSCEVPANEPARRCKPMFHPDQLATGNLGSTMSSAWLGHPPRYAPTALALLIAFRVRAQVGVDGREHDQRTRQLRSISPDRVRRQRLLRRRCA